MVMVTPVMDAVPTMVPTTAQAIARVMPVRQAFAMSCPIFSKVRRLSFFMNVMHIATTMPPQKAAAVGV